MRAAREARNRQRGFESAVEWSRVVERRIGLESYEASATRDSIEASSRIAFGLECAAVEIDRIERIASSGSGEPTSSTRIGAVGSVIARSVELARAERDRVAHLPKLDAFEILRAASMLDLARAAMAADRAARASVEYGAGHAGLYGADPFAIAQLTFEQHAMVVEDGFQLGEPLPRSTFEDAARSVEHACSVLGDRPDIAKRVASIASSRAAALIDAGADFALDRSTFIGDRVATEAGAAR